MSDVEEQTSSTSADSSSSDKESSPESSPVKVVVPKTKVPENPKPRPGPSKSAMAKALAKPSTAEMVNEAIETLAERGGTSLQAIKKFVTQNYNLDIERQARFIRRYLKSAVESGALVQTKGIGANGSFKFPSKSAKSKALTDQKKAAAKEPAKKKMAAKKKSTLEKRKSPAAKRAAEKVSAGNKKEAEKPEVPAKKKKIEEKAAIKKKGGEVAIPAGKKGASKKESLLEVTSKTRKGLAAAQVLMPKSPSKAKKIIKSPTSKPKAPKPKRAH